MKQTHKNAFTKRAGSALHCLTTHISPHEHVWTDMHMNLHCDAEARIHYILFSLYSADTVLVQTLVLKLPHISS